jgi:enoyl-CoA hydratase/carnithine racemase
MLMSCDEIISRTCRNVGWVIINRPASSNAVKPSTMKALCQALDRHLDDSEVNAIAIRGEGRHFLAGADLQWLEELTSATTGEVRAELYEYFLGAIKRVFHSPKPTLAAVNGSAITVGCELALACDFRLASDTAVFQESWIRLGLIPPLGGALLLPRFVGLAQAKAMILDAKPMSASDALQCGLVEAVVPEKDLEQHAQKRAEALSKRPLAAYRFAKEALHRGLSSTMENEWATNIAIQSILLADKDFAQRLQVLKRRTSNAS